jgi:pantothenate kinase
LITRLDPQSARARAIALLRDRRRSILGVTGSPGAGKSTYAEGLVRDLAAAGHRVALVPMDGFHLAHSALVAQGLVSIKGAPETFDAGGYADLLRRLREPDGETVWAPRFDRDLEDAIAASLPVHDDVQLIVTEGNYLLLDQGPWARVRPLLDECWYLELDHAVRRERLLARHIRHGRPAADALARTDGSDEANARLIATTRCRADAILTIPA